MYEEPEELKRAPHSFVIHRGQIGKSLLQLVKDFRKVMEPFTASSLQVIDYFSFSTFEIIYTTITLFFIFNRYIRKIR